MQFMTLSSIQFFFLPKGILQNYSCTISNTFNPSIGFQAIISSKLMIPPLLFIHPKGIGDFPKYIPSSAYTLGNCGPICGKPLTGYPVSILANRITIFSHFCIMPHKFIVPFLYFHKWDKCEITYIQYHFINIIIHY